jgi:hypothetical protein
MKLCQLRRPYIVEWQDDYERWMGKKAVVAYLKNLPRRTEKKSNIRYLGQNSKPGPPERDAGVLTDDPAFDELYISFRNVARLSGLTLQAYIFFCDVYKSGYLR